MGIFAGSAGGTRFGTLAMVWTLMGPMYILGALLFGIATLRAGILSRWAAGLFGFGAVFARVRAASTRGRAAGGGAGGSRFGMARRCALV